MKSPAFGELLHRVSAMVEDIPEITELDLNPVIAGPDGCVVVDARVRVGLPPRSALAKTW